MIKKMSKVIAILVISMFALTSNINIAAAFANDEIYEKHYQANLSSLNVTLENDQVKVTKKDVPLFKKLQQAKDMDVLVKQILTNDQYVADLKEMIKNGKTPIAIGVAEAKFLKTVDENGNVITSRPLTNKEVAQLDNPNLVYAQSGQQEYWDGLYLYTSVSGTSPDYWVQGNSYWGSYQTSTGDEVLGLTWEDDFRALNNHSATIEYLGGTESAGLAKFDPYKGAAWRFHDSEYAGGGWWNMLEAAYVGISVTRDGSYGPHYFTSEYIHTYTTTTWSVTIEGDASSFTGWQINLSPQVQEWNLVSFVEGDF